MMCFICHFFGHIHPMGVYSLPICQYLRMIHHTKWNACFHMKIEDLILAPRDSITLDGSDMHLRIILGSMIATWVYKSSRSIKSWCTSWKTCLDVMVLSMTAKLQLHKTLEATYILTISIFMLFQACMRSCKWGVIINLSRPATGMKHGYIYISHGSVLFKSWPWLLCWCTTIWGLQYMNKNIHLKVGRCVKCIRLLCTFDIYNINYTLLYVSVVDSTLGDIIILEGKK